MVELQADNAKLKSKLEEPARQSEQADKELNELLEDLAETQRLIKEQNVDRHKADDELLSLMKETETLKAKRPSKSITDYKQSVGFEWGLRWIGQVSHEYEYRVALARFHARYPDLEVDVDPLPYIFIGFENSFR
ncbi:hypothetical protein BHM03_00008929 [Ensete ventricosum]|nr:hypothetical protein BHM03_00008929 [Ensete ventricosum]